MADTHVKLPNSWRAPPKHAVRLRDVDPQSHVEVTVTLVAPELPAPDKMPATAMSRKDIDKKFGVGAEVVRKVEDVLRRFGLHPRGVRQAGRSVRMSGPASAMIAAFRPTLGIYIGPDGEFRDREGDLWVPVELDGLVSGVEGLGQRRMARRHEAAITVSTTKPLTPQDLRQLYAFPNGDGAGRAVAIAEFGAPLNNGKFLPPAYIPSDVTAFCQAHGIAPPMPRVVAVNIAPLNQTQYETYMQQLPQDVANLLWDQTAETMMDVQIVAGLCPGADISVYFASWDQKGWVDFLDEVTSATPKPVSVSISYGLAEESSDWSQGAMNSINHRLQIAAMQGITVCVSSGDDGAGCGASDNRVHVEFPSASPFVLAVGGTMLTDTGQGAAEVVWWENPGWRSSNGGGATGGGVSALNPRPTWQAANIKSLNPSAPAGRIVPDVAALSGAPGYDLLLDGKPLPGAGTSAATPLWASLIALVDAALPKAKQQRFLPRLLYGQGVGTAGFRDVTTGHNVSTPHPNVGYHAGAGFDAVTGWGVPIGTALLAAL